MKNLNKWTDDHPVYTSVIIAIVTGIIGVGAVIIPILI